MIMEWWFFCFNPSQSSSGLVWYQYSVKLFIFDKAYLHVPVLATGSTKSWLMELEQFLDVRKKKLFLFLSWYSLIQPILITMREIVLNCECNSN